MRIGIFAKTFVRPSLEEVFDAVSDHGLACIQFNFSVAGLPTLPERIPDDVVERVVRAAAERGITIAAVSGTFNMIDPDVEKRRAGLRRLRILAEAAAGIGAPVVTLCSGSRDAHDMWRWHPGNADPDAWHDLVRSMRDAIAAARDNGVTVAFEPEAANVVNTARKARRLLDELEAPEVRVVIDPANLVQRDEPERMAEVIDEAIDLLAGELVLAHAKDVASDSDGAFAPAGRGALDYDRYLRRLYDARFDGPLILHSLSETDVDACVTFLRAKLAAPLPREGA